MDKKSIFFILLSIVILVVMLYLVGIDKILSAWAISDKYLIVFGIVIELFTIFLYNLRWNVLNKMASINISFKKLLPMTLVGLAINNITPSGRGGGEPVRAYILSREESLPFENTFATVIADRTLDTFPFIVLAIITVLGVIFYYPCSPILLVVMVIAILAIVAILIIVIFMCINDKFGEKVSNFIINLLRRFYKKNNDELENKVKKGISDFQKTMAHLISNKKTFWQALPLSFVIWGFEIFRVYIIFLAFGATISPIVIAEVFILACLVGMIPLLPGGLGAVDGVMIIFYSAAGISPSLAAATTVIERLISFWLPTILGMVIIPYYGSSILDKISTSSSEEEMVKELSNED